MDRRDARLHPFLGLDPPAQDIAFVLRKPESGGTPTPPGVEFVRYRRFRGLGFRPIAPRTPRIAVRAVFRALPGQKGHPVGQRLATGGSSRPRPSRLSSRLAGPSRITSAGSSGTIGQRSVAATGFGAWSTPPPAASAARRKPGGQRGHGPPPASAGDARSVATRGMRITRGSNHGRKPRKSNQDCTIRHSCRRRRSCSSVLGWREYYRIQRESRELPGFDQRPTLRNASLHLPRPYRQPSARPAPTARPRYLRKSRPTPSPSGSAAGRRQDAGQASCASQASTRRPHSRKRDKDRR